MIPCEETARGGREGADVLRVDRPNDPGLGVGAERWYDVMARGRRSVTLDLKRPDGVAAAIALGAKADAVIEGFRPGVMERLGLGPDVLLAAEIRLGGNYPAPVVDFPSSRAAALAAYATIKGAPLAVRD